ncbi:hypothetical protein D3C81_1953830 [compost metagenome]
MAQRGFAGSIVDMDPHRNALHNLHPVARGVLGRQQGEARTGCWADAFHGAMPGDTRISVYLNGYALADVSVGQLGLFR